MGANFGNLPSLQQLHDYFISKSLTKCVTTL